MFQVLQNVSYFVYLCRKFLKYGIFEEIISMLHCFSMKMYSKRRRKNSK